MVAFPRPVRNASIRSSWWRVIASDHLRSQGYDGTAAMRVAFRGVQAIVKVCRL